MQLSFDKPESIACVCCAQFAYLVYRVHMLGDKAINQLVTQPCSNLAVVVRTKSASALVVLGVILKSIKEIFARTSFGEFLTLAVARAA